MRHYHTIPVAIIMKFNFEHILRVGNLERHPASGLAQCQNWLESGVVLASSAVQSQKLVAK